MQMSEHENLPDEARFIREYVALTGATESQGRSAFMYVCDQPVPAERAVNPEITEFESVTTTRLKSRPQGRDLRGRGPWPANPVHAWSEVIAPAAS